MPIHSISRCWTTLYIYDMDVGCSLRGFGGPTNRQNKKKTHQNWMLASKRRKKREKTSFGHDNFFLSKSLLTNIHTTHHIYKVAVRRKCVWKYYFLREFPTVAPSWGDRKGGRIDITKHWSQVLLKHVCAWQRDTFDWCTEDNDLTRYHLTQVD